MLQNDWMLDSLTGVGLLERRRRDRRRAARLNLGLAYGSSITEQLTQELACVGFLPSSNHATNTGDNSIAGIDMSVLGRLITFATVGVVNTGGSMQLYYQASATANMASPTNVASSVPLTGNTSNRLESLEVRADQLPAGTRYVQPILVVAGSQVNVGLICLASSFSYHPASQFKVTNILDQGLVT